ncbi:MAG: KTSC domain-containing protein, partial [Selenomonadaceae bacterium]|nr:KTSC domain-containing protein [Selenomonadaceae bacterium]
MEIIKVSSSVIKKIVYDDTTLFIKFIDNGWYRYRNF